MQNLPYRGKKVHHFLKTGAASEVEVTFLHTYHGIGTERFF
jgi:hypothetical protein